MQRKTGRRPSSSLGLGSSTPSEKTAQSGFEASSEQKGIEHALRERVKELRCLYGIAKLVESHEPSLDIILQGVADLLPSSWQYPEVTCARILFAEKEYTSPGFQETPYKQSADILTKGKKAGAVEVYYTQEMPPSDEGPFLKEERALIDAVAESLSTTAKRMLAEHALRERVKELRCLYGIAKLVERHEPSLDAILQGAVDLLPASWQYPEVTCARILFAEKQYTSSGFQETRHKQSADIILGGKKAGVVEVYYTRKMPPADEGPFLSEERALINAVADRLGSTANRMRMEEELHSAHAQLQVERKALQESNAALRAVLSRIEDEKSAIKEAIMANVDKIIMPILHAMETEIEPEKKGYVRLLRRNLEEITSPLVDRLSRRFLKLTPAELRTCNMIRMGLGTKEIAGIRHVSPATVNRQRESIRRKLAITGKNVNLVTFLQTFNVAVHPIGQMGRYGLDSLAVNSASASESTEETTSNEP
jgi:GAF domain-containing protein/DNA-binding CsgD family transcriptional regulator